MLTVTLAYQAGADQEKAIGNGVERGFAAALGQLDDLLHALIHERTPHA